MLERIIKILKLYKQDDYWHGRQSIGQCYSVTELKGYYNDLTKKVIATKDLSIDSIIKKVLVDEEEFIHPVTVCQVGLGTFDLYLKTNNEIYLKQVISCCDWLLDTCLSDASFCSWSVPYSFKLFGMSKGFKSGLIQGQAISLLVRAYSVTKDDRYLDLSYKALNFLIKPVQDGGCRVQGKWIYEEYPNKKENNLVLNGAISAYWGIYDLSIVSNKAFVGNILKKSTEDIISLLNCYDMGIYSRYCLKKNCFYYNNIASPYYHREHIEQLKILYEMTKNSDVLKILEKFISYDKPLNAFLSKIVKGLCLFMQKILGYR